MKFEQSFIIGNCQVIPIEYAIKFEHQDKQSLQPKFIEVLCYLAEHYPRVVPREELIENVWAGNNYVGENALTNAIWHLRQHLKSVDETQSVIETIRKVGYRLLVTPQYCQPEIHDKQQAQVEAPARTKKLHFYSLLGLGLCLLLSVIFLFRQSAVTYEQPIITQITKNPGSELFASPSPDGKKIVFKWQNGQNINNLFIKDRDNPRLEPKQLTFGDAYVGHSVWSNNGQYVYFARKDKAKDSCQIIQHQVLTHQEKAIVDCPTNGGYYYLDISPDDNTLAFHGYQAPADDSGIYFIDLNDAQSQPVRFSCSNNCGYKDRDFVFSPDGQQLAVTRRVNRFNENLYLVDIQTKEATQLTFDEEDIVGLTWHPNGKSLVYGAQRADNRRGYIVDLSTGEITDMQIDGFSYPAFAKQTHELFYQQRSEKYHLANLALNSEIASSPFPVVESEFNHQDPHYSNKSKKLAYVSNESGYYELWVSDHNGEKRQQLTFLKQTVRFPRWSHDGEKIAFLAPVKANLADKIYIYDLNSQTLSIVPSQHQSHNRPTWSWDDSAIISAVYEKEYTDLHQINIATGESTRISYDGSRYGLMISPTTLLYTSENSGLWQKEINIDENNNTLPIVKIHGDDFKARYSWTYTPKGIYFTQTFDRHRQLSFYQFESHQTKPLLKLPKYALGSGLTVIDEKNELLFTQASSRQADIKKIEHPLLK